MSAGNRWPSLRLPACLVVLTSIALFAGMEVPLSRLEVPYTYWGDAVDKLAQIQTVAETGWLFDNPRIGYPFGYDRLDFPRFDSLNYALMGPVAAITGESGLAMNLYYIASYFLIGLAALFSFRRLGLSEGPALLCSLAYAFLPYHQIRGVAHLTNGTYFLVPFAMLTLMWLARGELQAGVASRWRWIIALATALLLPLQTPYNGVFFALLCGVAFIIAIGREPRWSAAWPAAVLVLAVCASFVVEQFPAMLHKSSVGANASVAARTAYESELYSLRLNQVVLPFASHRLDVLAHAKQAFDTALEVPKVESRDQYIGLIGLLGLLGLAWSLTRGVDGRFAPEPLEAYTRIAALLAIAILLLAMSSGLLTIFSHLVTAKIRASNRILPFLAFAVLLGAGWILQAAKARIHSNAGRVAAFAVIAVVVLADLSTPRLLAGRDATIDQFDSDRRFFTDVERTLEPGSAVFQLPVVSYPEHGPVGHMPDYEEFKPYLHSHSLKFSYGGANGRRGYSWGTAAGSLPIPDMVQKLRGQGFSAVLVNTKAYEPGELRGMVSGLSTVLRQEPKASQDRRWLLFMLTDGLEDPPALHLGSLPYRLGDGALNFSRGGNGGLYLVDGWATPEQWGTWSLGSSSTLQVRLEPAPKTPVYLTADFRVLLGPRVPERVVKVGVGERVLAEIRRTRDTASGPARIHVPPDAFDKSGTLNLRFDVFPVASPLDAGINADMRPLGIGLTTLDINTSLPEQ